MSIRHNGKVIAGATQYHPDLFDWKWADHQLDDVQWLRADTFSWQSGAVYESAYQHLVDDIDGQTAQTESIAGITISFYLANDGHKITTDESAVAQIYAATGVAWYYIIDTANTRFKLPRTKFGFTGIRSGVGDYVEAGLPNITGTMTAGSWASGFGYEATATGAFYNVNSWGNDADGGGATTKRGIGIDASRSSSIYGNSNTVQPKATEMYLYFYVGNFTQTALENTAGLNAELFNGKADLDLNNVSAGIDFVVESQLPTALNNYTWYRKYKSGWVEQGGLKSHSTGTTDITLPIEMSDTNYSVLGSFGTGYSAANNNNFVLVAYSTTTIRLTDNNSGSMYWIVSGIAA